MRLSWKGRSHETAGGLPSREKKKEEEKMKNKQYPQHIPTNKQQSSETGRGCSCHTVRGPAHRSAFKEESKVINHNWVTARHRALMLQTIFLQRATALPNRSEKKKKKKKKKKKNSIKKPTDQVTTNPKLRLSCFQFSNGVHWSQESFH